MKYYTIRILVGLFFMGSFGVGFLTYAEYGKWFGWLSFIAIAAIGIFLHIWADRIQRAGEA